MDLDLLEFESHLLRVPRHRHSDLRSVTVGIRQIVPEKPGMATLPRFRQLQLGQQPVPASVQALSHGDHSRNHQRSIHPDGILHLDGERRELHEALRCGDMLITQGGEAMVGGYEEILARDVRLVVKRWLVRHSLFPILMPERLRGLVQSPPCGQRPAMHLQVRQLPGSAWIIPGRTLPVVALTTPVIEGDITHGTVGVTDQDRWLKGRHTALQVLNKAMAQRDLKGGSYSIQKY